MKDLSKEVVPEPGTGKTYEMIQNLAEYLGVSVKEAGDFYHGFTLDFLIQNVKPGMPQEEVFKSLEGLFRD